MPGATKIDQSFFEITGIKLPTTSQLRLFNIMLDEDRSTKFMNIFKTLRINTEVLTDISSFDTYEVEGEGEAWFDNISFDVYGTPFLWWVIALFNDITNPFEELEPGSNLKILKQEHLYPLFRDIEAISEL
jgi:hypothetical protein